jgi:hypothetical protein
MMFGLLIGVCLIVFKQNQDLVLIWDNAERPFRHSCAGRNRKAAVRHLYRYSALGLPIGSAMAAWSDISIFFVLTQRTKVKAA